MDTQIPGYPFITLGGAVAANSHGKSCGVHGTIRKSIKASYYFIKKMDGLNYQKKK